jgi:hypothetical protein
MYGSNMTRRALEREDWGVQRCTDRIVAICFGVDHEDKGESTKTSSAVEIKFR